MIHTKRFRHFGTKPIVNRVLPYNNRRHSSLSIYKFRIVDIAKCQLTKINYSIMI